MVFSYFLTPKTEKGQQPILYCFTVEANNKITLYYIPSKSDWKAPDRWMLLKQLPANLAIDDLTWDNLADCLLDYQDSQNEGEIDFIQTQMPIHHKMHKNQINSNKVPHSHVDFRSQEILSPKMLQNFLTSLRTCKRLKNLPANQVLFDKEIQKDIIEKYQQFLQQPTLNQASNTPCLFESGRDSFPNQLDYFLCINSPNTHCINGLLKTEAECKEATDRNIMMSNVSLATSAALFLFCGLFCKNKCCPKTTPSERRSPAPEAQPGTGSPIVRMKKE